MKISSFLRVVGALLLSALVALATAVPATASDLFEMRLSAPVSLELDAAAHVAIVVDGDASGVQAMAFMSKARGHDLFNGDHFGLGCIDARL